MSNNPNTENSNQTNSNHSTNNATNPPPNNNVSAKVTITSIRTSNVPIQTTTKGIITAFSAFLIWGSFPLYFKQLADYNPIEIITHRIVWTFIFLLLVIIITKRFSWIKQLRENPKWLLFTFFSGIIITTNWLSYVWAVNNDQVLEASLGYFMSPLFGVSLSLIILHERLRKLQWIAIGFASLSIIIQLIMMGSLPWVSLALALTFSVYGMIQRKTPLMAIDALFLETALMLPFFVIWLMQADVASSHPEFWISDNIWLLIMAGPITLVPLLLFNKSTKMVAFSILSFMNYLTPSFLFFLAIFYYKEPLDIYTLATFSLIWVGLVLFSIDLWQNRPSKKLKQSLVTEK